MIGWINNEVSDGLSALVALRLKNGPSLDQKTIEALADVWVLAFSQRVSDEGLDAPRIRAAFAKILPIVAEWPAPKQVIDLMPARPQLQALPLPPLRDDEWERGQAMFRELIESVVDHVKMPVPPKRTKR